jgi:hypothetical protein
MQNQTFQKQERDKVNKSDVIDVYTSTNSSAQKIITSSKKLLGQKLTLTQFFDWIIQCNFNPLRQKTKDL